MKSPFLLATALVICAACAPRNEVDALRAEMAKLERRIAELENHKESPPKVGLDNLDGFLKDQIETVIFGDPLIQSAYIRIGRGYDVAWSRSGPIAVSFLDIRALGAGARVKLELTNLTSVTLGSVEATIGYMNYLPDDTSASERKRMEASFKILQDLPPGKATIIEADLSEIPHDQIKGMSVSLLPGGMRSG